MASAIPDRDQLGHTLALLSEGVGGRWKREVAANCSPQEPKSASGHRHTTHASCSVQD